MIRASWRILVADNGMLRPYYRPVASWGEAERIVARLNEIAGEPFAFVEPVTVTRYAASHGS